VKIMETETRGGSSHNGYDPDYLTPGLDGSFAASGVGDDDWQRIV
jgi:hypothetical protein